MQLTETHKKMILQHALRTTLIAIISVLFVEWASGDPINWQKMLYAVPVVFALAAVTFFLIRNKIWPT